MAPKKRTSSPGETKPTKKAKATNGHAKEEEGSESPPPASNAREAGQSEASHFPEGMANVPLAKLYNRLAELEGTKAAQVDKDGVVVHWMRNKDLRITDNRGLALASRLAQDHSVPLVVLHVFSPSDYTAHDRSPRRIDFQIRQLHLLQPALAKLNVPLFTVTWEEREEIPKKVVKLMEEWKAVALVGNLEYEVDELGRDTEIVERVAEARKKGKGGWKGDVRFEKDFVIVPPGEIVTGAGKPYSVFSPWYNNWVNTISKDPGLYLDDAGTLDANPTSAKSHVVLKKLLEHKIPKFIEGWKLSSEDQKTMEHLWQVGVENQQIMERFLSAKLREQAFQHPPLHPGHEKVPLKDAKIGVYKNGRNRVDMDGTSHISAYLATGMISPRQCLRATMELTGGKLRTDKMSDGVGMWVSEVAWRDFYQHVLAAWPRVCRTRPFNLNYDDIVWEESDEHLQAWKDGKTGFPIVDAAMRALKTQGYMHNRCRMIVAMFLTKDLMLDWRLGEKWFMQNLIDGDFGSNNGGWQWSASTGCDPQPYFRVFNPTAQSEKSDVSGDYIRHWVPELKKLKGKVIHDPSSHLSEKEFEKLGYPKPIVDHSKARVRAIARYKNPGEKVDE
ncbi:hypothetical protein MNV49_002278 [Pseudohyphozyma bogoriensis]|nr:hypothetical protein MNV49_002278 [Pseudohyphozyma bogoriensis]